jgi:misacylated tRNA(Ala) deacylase
MDEERTRMADQPDEVPGAPPTELLYQTDAYRRDFGATVVAIDGDGAIILDRTAFFPGGGGQPPDRGTLHVAGTACPLDAVRQRAGRVAHHLAPPPGGAPAAPAPGTAVRGVLDWEHRYALMRTHTAMHILSAVIWRDWQCQVTGSNMKPLEGRMDFEFEGMPAELAGEIVRRANLEVASDRAVTVDQLPRDEALAIPDLIRTKVNLLPPTIREIRTVRIEGLDLQADGGTHVARTGEVGTIHLLRHESKGRINKRLRVRLDPAARPVDGAPEGGAPQGGAPEGGAVPPA